MKELICGLIVSLIGLLIAGGYFDNSKKQKPKQEEDPRDAEIISLKQQLRNADSKPFTITNMGTDEYKVIFDYEKKPWKLTVSRQGMVIITPM